METITKSKSKILIVDDEAALRKMFVLIFTKAGYEVVEAGNGDAAINCLDEHQFNVIISDVNMPGLTGIQLLRQIREKDADVPVILITGLPEIEGAMKAVEFGAFQYLSKPIDLENLTEIAEKAVQLHKMAILKRSALALMGENENSPGDLAGLEVSFKSAIEQLWMAYQPIVSVNTKRIYAYEALMRSKESALPHPGAILGAAERLRRLPELGRKIRSLVVEPLHQCDPDVLFFVNLHPEDLLDANLFSSSSPLTQVANRIVLEITERSSMEEIPNGKKIIAQLKQMGFKIAIDDLGAGYAGLTSFALLEPEIVKIDMALVREINMSVTKQKIVRSMVDLCKDMGILVVAEGIETVGERDVLMQMGCDLLQGYLLAKPGTPFPDIVWH